MQTLSTLAVVALFLGACRTRPFDVTGDGGADLRGAADLSSDDLRVCPIRLQRMATPGRIQCGQERTCALAEGCCGGALATDLSRCSSGSSSCSGPQLHCDGPEDCPAGEECCLSLGFVRSQDRSHCAASCQEAFCHSDRDCNGGSVCYVDNSYFDGLVGSCRTPCDP